MTSITLSASCTFCGGQLMVKHHLQSAYCSCGAIYDILTAKEWHLPSQQIKSMQVQIANARNNAT